MKFMSNWNGKVKCVRQVLASMWKKDKIYNVIDGRVEHEEDYTDAYENFEDFQRATLSDFEEISIPQPHKSLLKSGMKVVYRNGTERYVFLPAGVFMDENGTTGNSLSYYSDDMLFKSCSFSSPRSQDIMEIYTEDCELIAKREEKSAKDTKIEELEKRMRELADEIAGLKGV